MVKDSEEGKKQKCYLVKEDESRMVFSDARFVDNPSSLNIINHDIRVKILQLLSKTPSYPAEIAKTLGLHEQKVYYHVKQMMNAGFIEVVDRNEIRGTIAKKFAPTSLNFAVSLGGEWNPLSQINKTNIDKKLELFFSDFMKDGEISGTIVVGSPDPHGEFKAYSRDGHYAVDLALFLGNYVKLADKFSVMLDVDVKNEKEQNNPLILIGGPVTNTLVAEVNDVLPVRFSDKRPWGLTSLRTAKTYTDDTVGLIAKIPNPFNDKTSIIILAGIRFIGTKAAVMAITRHYKPLLQTFSGQKRWAAVVQGFDMDGDGKIDTVEILE